MDKDHQLENLKKDLEAKGNLVEVCFSLNVQTFLFGLTNHIKL